MILGYVLLSLALASTVIANLLFTLAKKPGAENMFKAARGFAVLAATSVVAASGTLVYLIAGHHFEVAYVAEYSARRSNQWYLLAAFWGGQEGSLLLWGLWTAILGAILAFRSGDKTSRVWPIWGIVQVFLLGLILLKCPFALGKGPVPDDGRGLNPLLENMWMVIHPPILFLGFASTLAPFVWTMYGLIYRDWDGWAKSVFSWILFSFAVLGFGLSLGGYWAYETLGWGGFWAWDPVENSSLVPWLFLTAILHGIPLQLKNGGYKVSNLLLGFLPFATMFYGTFLTRSGVLTDFSVHSFSSLGNDGYYILLTGVLLSFLVPLGFLLWNFRAIPKPPAYERVETREFGYFLASMTMGLLGLIVAIGMSAPLITKGLGAATIAIAKVLKSDAPSYALAWASKGAGAEQPYYNQAAYPLAILFTVAMAVTPYLSWKAAQKDAEKDMEGVRKRLIAPYAGAILLTVVSAGLAMYLGLRRPYQILLFATSVFSVLANVILLLPRLKHRSSRKTVGGFVAHIGAGMVLIGVCSLVVFSKQMQRVMLIKNFPVDVMGYKLTYLGNTSHPYDRSNNALRIRIEKDGRVWEGRPRFYYAQWENRDTVFANPPAILPSVYNMNSVNDLPKMLPWNNPFPLGDLYLAFSEGPFSMGDGKDRPLHPNAGFELKNGAMKTFEQDGYSFALLSFTMDKAAMEAVRTGNEKAMKALPKITFTAQIGVMYGKEGAMVEPHFVLEQKTGAQYSHPAQIPGPKGEKVMLNLVPPSPEQWKSADPFSAINFQTINVPDVTEHIYVDISTKPLISLVWIGSLLYTLGGLVAYRRRAIEQGIMDSGKKPGTVTAE
jgi:cytochrome c-type biogenesis protein CcmF